MNLAALVLSSPRLACSLADDHQRMPGKHGSADSNAPAHDSISPLPQQDVLYDGGRDSEEDERLLLQGKTRETQSSERYLFDESKDDQYDDLSITQKHENQHDDDEDDERAQTSSRGTRNRLTASERSASKRRKKFYKESISVILPMILLSLVGSTLAGEIVDSLKFWEVFQVVPELFILVPIMLNLKGNIEMNLAARFSTSANIGELDIRRTRQTLVSGNLALLQVQALFVSLLAGMIAFGLGMAFRHTGAGETFQGPQRGGWFECVMVLISSMVAAGLSSAVVGSFMCALVIISRRYGVDPDNIATPLAASLGDLISLAILGEVSTLFLSVESTLWTTVIFIVLLLFISLNVWFVLRNAYVQELLWSGWGALIGAMVISSGTGLILERVVNSFKGYALLGPVVTGVAANVGAVLVSRISTSLHSSTFSTSPHTLTAILLFVLSTPILVAFLPFADALDSVSTNALFYIFYSLCCAITIGGALACAHVLSVFLWKNDWDPDIHALPVMSALMDVVGQVLLALAFWAAGLKGVGFTQEEREALPINNGTAAASAMLSSSTSIDLSQFLAEASSILA